MMRYISLSLVSLVMLLGVWGCRRTPLDLEFDVDGRTYQSLTAEAQTRVCTLLPLPDGTTRSLYLSSLFVRNHKIGTPREERYTDVVETLPDGSTQIKLHWLTCLVPRDRRSAVVTVEANPESEDRCISIRLTTPEGEAVYLLICQEGRVD